MHNNLEITLQNFLFLTVGDNIMVAYKNKKYNIDIIESKPAPAISIIETDCEVDFAPPLDYPQEPECLPPPPAPVSTSSSGLFSLA
jgi:ubiquitin fusion degradation protein 1